MANLSDLLGSADARLTSTKPGAATPGQGVVASGDGFTTPSDFIRTPVAISPVTGTSGVATNTTLSADGFDAAFDQVRSFRRFEVRELGQTDWLTLIFSEEINANTSSTISPLLAEDSAFEWRCRDVAVDGTMSDWMVTQSFTTGNAFIVTPTVMVEGEPSDVPESPIVSTSEFQTVGAADTHASTDWEVRLQADNTLVYSSIADTVNLTSIQVPEGFLLENTTYIFRARHNGATLPPSAYGEKIATTELEFFRVLTATTNSPPYVHMYDQEGATFNNFQNLDIIPGGGGLDTSFPTDGSFLAVAHSGPPFITIYSRSGKNFNKVPDPDILPTNAASGCAFSPDANFLAVAHQSSPFITIYSRSGNVFTKVANPNVLPGGNSLISTSACAFSPQGDILAVSHRVAPYLILYSRSGNTFTNITIDSDTTLTNAFDVAFSLEGDLLALANGGLRGTKIYSRSGNTFTKLQDILTGAASGVAFSPDGELLAVLTGAPEILLFARNGSSFAPLPSPDIQPTTSVRRVAFSEDSSFLAVSQTQPPQILLYSRSGNTFTKIAEPDVLPIGQGSSVGFYPVAVPGSR